MSIIELLVNKILVNGDYIHYSFDGGGDTGDARDITIERNGASISLLDEYEKEYNSVRNYIFHELETEISFTGTGSVSGEGTLKVENGELIHLSEFYYTNNERFENNYKLQLYIPDGFQIEKLNVLGLLNTTTLTFKFEDFKLNTTSSDGDFNIDEFLDLKEDFNKFFESSDFIELIQEDVDNESNDFEIVVYYNKEWFFDVVYNKDVDEDAQTHQWTTEIDSYILIED